ncbi:MAG: phosphopantothenate/pantothenate synthetase family protein [Desulfurococcus sp.]
MISVNGNTVALVPREVVELSRATGAKIEVNLFHLYWGLKMSEVYVFRATISKLGRGRSLGIYIPKSVAEKIGHLHGKEVVVVVYTTAE